MSQEPVHGPGAPAHPETGLSRLEILRAAQRCFNQHGYDGTTIRRIAGEMNCAVGSIYRYFRDKRELLLTLAQLDLQPVAEHLQAGGSWRQSLPLYHQLATAAADRYPMMFWLTRLKPSHPTSSASPASVAAPVPGDSTTAAILTLPPVVQQILALWEQALDSREIAYRLFIVLHGCIMAGLDGDTSLAMAQKQLPVMASLHPTETGPSPQTSSTPKPQVVPVAALGQVMRQPVLVTLDALSLTQSSPPPEAPMAPSESPAVMEIPLGPSN